MIYENERELAIVKELCNIALKAGGIQNLAAINEFLACLKPAQSSEPKPEAKAS